MVREKNKDMRLLSSGPDDPVNGLIPEERPLFPTIAQQPFVIPNGSGEPEATQAFNVLGLLRKYWLLALSLMVLGSAAGFASIVLSSPMYKTLLLMEVTNTNTGLTQPGAQPVSSETSEVDIQTQVNLLHSDGFLRKGAERMQAETVPLPPTGRDIFSRLRQRIHPSTEDPLENRRIGLSTALKTFEARPVNHTRLIELSCESTSPDVAAGFLNAMAQEFVEDNSHSRITTALKTSEWLAAQIEETKSRVQEAEEKLREFVSASGNVFAGQDATLEDTKLTQIKAELARIQNERIARQTRYDLTVKNANAPESLAEVLDDSVLRGYQAQLQGLKRERAVLDLTYTAKDKKVQKVDAEIASVQKAYDAEISSTLKRIKNDYEASRSQEKALSGAYDQQAGRVGGQASKTAQYNSLKREVDTQHQQYQTLLVEQSQANLNSSVPVNPIRIVEQSTAPEEPYKPKPVLNISFGTLFGLVLAGAFVFVRERMDRSIKSPGASRRMFNAPELGVIPNLGSNAMLPKANGRKAQELILNNGHHDDGTALATWQSGPAFITESFRGTLASILRNQATLKNQKMILITSPGPAEGKTTVVQNLGIALAESGRKVLLVDADFRRPHLHRKFSLPNEWGLIDVLCDDTPLSDYAPEQLGVFTGFPGLSILTNRVTQNNVSKALYSPRLRTILETLVERYDMVIVDAPPILSVADTRIVASLTDALILVLRSGVTQREAAMEAYQLIQEDGLALLGTVLTDYDLSSDRRRQYYYDYGDPSRA
jgi:succinoglycan biosynthesis transport protein ExoP